MGIDGRTGAGKTSLAADVAAALHVRGRSAVVLSMDELYEGWNGVAAVGETVCRDVVGPLRQRRAPQVRRYDWQRQRLGTPQTLVVEDTLVLEGVGSTTHGCRELVDVTVWVQAPRDVRLARAFQRVGQGDLATHVDIWEAQEDALFGPDSYPHSPTGFDLVVENVIEGER